MNKLTPIIAQYVTHINLIAIVDFYKKENNLKYDMDVEISKWKCKIEEYYRNRTVFEYTLTACQILFVATGTYLKLNRNIFTNLPEKTNFVDGAEDVLQGILIDCFTRILNFGVPEAKLFSTFTDCFTVIAQNDLLHKKTMLKKLTNILKTNKVDEEQIKKDLQSCATIQ